MVQINSVSPVLLVADVLQTAEYYRDVLGFHFDQVYGQPPSFVIVERGGARLMFRQPPQGAPPPVNASIVPEFTWDVSVDDVEALAEELRGRGAEILSGPTLRPIWNGKEMDVRDCNGRVIGFGQAMD